MATTAPSATIGFASISALDRTLVEAAEVAARCGVDGLELTDRPPHGEELADPEAAARIGDAIRALGLEVLTYGSYLSCAEPDALDRVDAEVACAKALGAARLRVWATHQAGADGPGQPEVVALLQAVADAAGSDLDVVVERHDGSFTDTVRRTLDLLDAVDRPNLSLNYQVRDWLRPADLSGLPDDARALIPHATYFHLKNVKPNPDESGPLLPGGTLEHGEIDYRALLSAAVAAGYQGPYTIEFLSWEPKPLEEKLRADVDYLRGLLAEIGAP